MRHGVYGFKLGRDTEHRLAMFRNMTISLFTHGQITTTLPKAKAVQPFVEKLIAKARKGDLASRRQVISAIGDQIINTQKLANRFDPKDDEESDGATYKRSHQELTADGYRLNSRLELKDGPRIVKKLFDEIAPKYSDRPGGFTRIIKLAKHRVGDGADLVVLQLVGEEEDGPKVGGRYSRRRQKQDNRTAFAAKLRKARSGGGAAATEETASATTAEADAPEATDTAGSEESKD